MACNTHLCVIERIYCLSHVVSNPVVSTDDDLNHEPHPNPYHKMTSEISKHSHDSWNSRLLDTANELKWILNPFETERELFLLFLLQFVAEKNLKTNSRGCLLQRTTLALSFTKTDKYLALDKKRKAIRLINENISNDTSHLNQPFLWNLRLVTWYWCLFAERRHDIDIWELLFPALISLWLSSVTLKHRGCTTACKKLHEIFIGNRKLKRTTDWQHHSLNFPVSPEVMNEFSETFTTLAPPAPACALHYNNWLNLTSTLHC